MKRITYAFICQQGQLAGEALLLAASLRRHLTFDAKIAAVVPLPRRTFGTPPSAILNALRDLGVDVVQAHNPYMGPPPKRLSRYTGVAKAPFFTNKWVCLTHGWVDTDMVVFLDTDHLCCGPVTYGDWFEKQVVVRQVGRSAGKFLRHCWQDVFKHAKVAIPKKRVMHIGKFRGPELAQGGLVGLDMDIRHEFCDMWRKYWSTVKRGPLTNKYFAEQTGLALAVHACPWTVAMQPRSRSLRAEYYHYGKWPNVWRLRPPMRELQALLAEYPKILPLMCSSHVNAFTRQYFRRLRR